MGPSIYAVHTRGGQVQVEACGQGEGGSTPCGRPHRKLKLESTDIILSSRAKKLASFLPEFRLGINVTVKPHQVPEWELLHCSFLLLELRGVQYVHWVMHKCIMVKVGGEYTQSM